jgi:transposase
LSFQRAEADALRPPRLSRWQKKLHTLLQYKPRLFGWCRTRWSCACLALTLAASGEIKLSRETIRQEVRAAGYVWKRAKHKAPDKDPQRAAKLARIRYLFENQRPDELILFADELDIDLLPKLGYQWMLKGTQLEVETPGQNQKSYVAAALDPRTGELYHVVGPNKNNVLFRQLLDLILKKAPKRYRKIYVICDNYRIHKAKAVDKWLAAHPRLSLEWLPTYCPQANPIERTFGDVHDKVTRNHMRKKLRTLVKDVEEHFEVNGPWKYNLSKIYFTPEVDAALASLYQQAT